MVPIYRYMAYYTLWDASLASSNGKLALLSTGVLQYYEQIGEAFMTVFSCFIYRLKVSNERIVRAQLSVSASRRPRQMMEVTNTMLGTYLPERSVT